MQIVITSHSDLCYSLLNCYRMIVGEPSQFIAVDLNEQGINDYQLRFHRTLDQLLNQSNQQQILVLCDLFGGTPYNEAYHYSLAHPNQIFIVAGVNLPMLIEVGLATEKKIENLMQIAIDSGKEAIKTRDIDNSDNQDNELVF